MLTSEELRFAVTDVRERHKNLAALLDSGLKQALSILQLYIALAGTSLSGAAVLLLSKEKTYPVAVGAGLATFGLLIAIGAVAALAVLWPAEIRLAGHEPAFWRWADRPDVKADDAMRSYFDYVEDSIAINRKVNAHMGKAMLCAKICGATAPLAGLVAGLIVWFVSR